MPEKFISFYGNSTAFAWGMHPHCFPSKCEKCCRTTLTEQYFQLHKRIALMEEISKSIATVEIKSSPEERLLESRRFEVVLPFYQHVESGAASQSEREWQQSSAEDSKVKLMAKFSGISFTSSSDVEKMNSSTRTSEDVQNVAAHSQLEDVRISDQAIEQAQPVEKANTREINPHPSGKLVADYDRRAEEQYKNWAQENEMAVEEYKDALQRKAIDLIAEAEIWVRTRPEPLSQILDEGRFKTIFEKVPSSTAYDLGDRESVEKQLFSLESSSDPKERPIYGYLADSKTVQGQRGDMVMTNCYGAVAIRLKRENVMSRTTCTMDDSLDITLEAVTKIGDGNEHLGVIPVPYTQPERRMFSILDDKGDPLVLENLDSVIPYPEAHIHGGVAVQDIAEIYFHSNLEPELAIQNRLSELQIPYAYRNRQTRKIQRVGYDGAV